MQKLTLDTDRDASSQYGCVLGAVTKFGFEPPFNFCIVIDVSGSTSALFGGSKIGDINRDGKNDTILDAEIGSIIDVLESIVKAATLDNTNVEIGLVTFSTAATYHGKYLPIDPSDPAKVNPTLKSKLLSLRSGGTTNFDDALDKSIDYFNVAAPNRDNVLFFLSDGIPNVSGDGDGEFQVPSSDNQPNAIMYTSELRLLDALKVTRLAIGVGSGSSVIAGSGLDKIDNTPDPVTGKKAEQVTTTNALTDVLLHNPVVGYVISLTIKVNGIVQPNISASQVISGPAGYSFGSYIVTGLNPTLGFKNKIEAIVVMDYDKDIRTTADQQTLTTFTTVTGTI